jgi:hypothetical protein
LIELDRAVGPYETSSIDKASEGPPPIVVPRALTYQKTDFLRFLQDKTQGAKGEVKFAATRKGMENLGNLFPGGGPIEQSMPLPAVASSANDDSDG